MKRCSLLATLFLLLLGGFAFADISIDFLDRRTEVRYFDLGGVDSQFIDHRSDLSGPYSQDLAIDVGDLHARSIHESSVVVAGADLSVSGSYLSEVSDTSGSLNGQLEALALTGIRFTVSETSFMSLDVTLDGGELFCFDLTTNEGGLDVAGPGHFVLDDVLVAGHEYLFQVSHLVGIFGPAKAAGSLSAAFTLEVSNQPVATSAASWGGVKALFR